MDVAATNVIVAYTECLSYKDKQKTQKTTKQPKL